VIERQALFAPMLQQALGILLCLGIIAFSPVIIYIVETFLNVDKDQRRTAL